MNQAPGISGGNQEIIRKNYAALVEELTSKHHLTDKPPDFL